VDPLGSGTNRYAYGMGNPSRYGDPTGMQFQTIPLVSNIQVIGLNPVTPLMPPLPRVTTSWATFVPVGQGSPGSGFPIGQGPPGPGTSRPGEQRCYLLAIVGSQATITDTNSIEVAIFNWWHGVQHWPGSIHKSDYGRLPLPLDSAKAFNE